MPKAKHNKTGKPQAKRTSIDPEGVTELTDQELQQVQGGTRPNEVNLQLASGKR